LIAPSVVAADLPDFGIGRSVSQSPLSFAFDGATSATLANSSLTSGAPGTGSAAARVDLRLQPGDDRLGIERVPKSFGCTVSP